MGKKDTKRRPRLGSIDLLRGFFIVVMIIDHIARFPNGLDFISGRNQLWFSAAEGFVTISGLLVGYIYAPKILEQTKLIFTRLFRRAAILYVCVIGLALFFIGYSYMFLEATNFSHFNNVFELLVQLFSLHYSYGWAEFLTHYVIFLIAAPFALYLIAKRRGWIVLGLSFVLWLAHLWSSENQSRYDFAASWQLLFFVGMFIGAHLLSINAWVRARFSPKTIQYSTYGLWGAAVLLFITSSFLAYSGEFLAQNLAAFRPTMDAVAAWWAPINTSFFSWWTDKATVAPLRLMFGVVIFWALFTFFHRYSEAINRLSRGLFMVLGKQPLFAYCFGAIVIFAVEKYIPQPDEQARHFVANLIVTVGAIVITYTFTKLFTKLNTKNPRSPEQPS